MAISFNGQKRIRRSFGRIPEVAPMPNLIEVQRSSYDHFLQMGVLAENRGNVGLQEVFKSVFPIRDFSERAQLELCATNWRRRNTRSTSASSATSPLPRRSRSRCASSSGMSTRTPARARSGRHQEQDVYMGDMPLMTHNGTFIINGGPSGHRSADAPQARRVLRPTTRQDRTLGKIPVRRPGHPYRGSGSISRSTPGDHVYVASTGAANCRRRRCIARRTP